MSSTKASSYESINQPGTRLSYSTGLLPITSQVKKGLTEFLLPECRPERHEIVTKFLDLFLFTDGKPAFYFPPLLLVSRLIDVQ